MGTARSGYTLSERRKLAEARKFVSGVPDAFALKQSSSPKKSSDASPSGKMIQRGVVFLLVGLGLIWVFVFLREVGFAFRWGEGW